MPQRHNTDPRHLPLLTVSALILFLGILYQVSTGGYLTELDSWVYTQIVALQSPALTRFVIFVTNLNGVFGTILFGLCVIIFLTYKKWYNARRFYLLSLFGSLALFAGFKQLVARMRPHSELMEATNYAFPSGHATMSMTTALLVYFIFSPKLTSPLVRNLLLTACILWPLSIAFTRVYLHVHWMSDVLAGLALGLFWVTFVKRMVYDKTQLHG